MTGYAGKEPRIAQYLNGEAVQDAPCIAAPSVVYNTGSVSASTDPFTSKTNKYAESNMIMVFASAAFHIRMGTSSVGTAVTTDFPVPANTWVKLTVDPNAAYARVIPATGSATIFAVEVY